MERACARRAGRGVGAGVTMFSRVNRVCRVTVRSEGSVRDAIGPQVSDKWFLERGVVSSLPVVRVLFILWTFQPHY